MNTVASVVGDHPVLKFRNLAYVGTQPRRRPVVAEADVAHLSVLQQTGHSVSWSRAALEIIEAAKRTA